MFFEKSDFAYVNNIGISCGECHHPAFIVLRDFYILGWIDTHTVSVYCSHCHQYLCTYRMLLNKYNLWGDVENTLLKSLENIFKEIGG